MIVKANKSTPLFKVLAGSHLYGTATEKSDYDYKVVVLPPLNDLLLNKRITNYKEKPEGMKATDKMVAGETETEYIPLQTFFSDFFSGQTYALELAFAVAQRKHEAYGNIWLVTSSICGQMIERFLTKNVQKMVGYAVAQSRLYGLKTERYTSVKAFVQTVEDHFIPELGKAQAEKLMRTQKLQDSPMLLGKLLMLEHVKEATLKNAKGGMAEAPALDVCGKLFPMTNTWATVLSSMKTTLSNYGSRVADFEGEGVDWKALSHAIRITEQVIELSKTGTLTFPRPNADFLLAVKQGEVALDEANAYLEAAFKKVDEAVEKSVLREKTPQLQLEFEHFMLTHLRYFYELDTV